MGHCFSVSSALGLSSWAIDSEGEYIFHSFFGANLFWFRDYVCLSKSVTLNDTARVRSLCHWVCSLPAPQSLVSNVMDTLGLLYIFLGILLGSLEYEYRLTPMPNWSPRRESKTFWEGIHDVPFYPRHSYRENCAGKSKSKWNKYCICPT